MARFSLNTLKDFLEGLRVEDGRNFLERPCFHYLFRVNEIAFIERCHTIEKKIFVSQVLVSLTAAKTVSAQKNSYLSRCGKYVVL